MTEEKKQQKYQNIQTGLPVIAAAVTAVIFITLFLGLKHPELPLIRHLASGSLILYVGSFVIGAVIFILLRLFFMYIPLPGLSSLFGRRFSRKTASLISGCICGLIAVLLIRRRFFSEFHEYPARDIPYKSFHLLPVPTAVFLIGVVGFLLLAVLRMLEGSRPVRVLTWIVYCFSVSFVSLSLYTSTLDKNSSFDVYHGSAYIQSIYNALYYLPFNTETTGIYGHYGIIYAAVMRLFRLKSEFVFVLIALAGAVTTICSIYVIHSLIRSDFLRITAALSLAVPQALVYMKNYWMTYPHKTLFPMLLIAWLIFSFRHEKPSEHPIRSGFRTLLFVFIAYLISVFGIVWNTETGLYCLVCAAGAYIIRGWQTRSWMSGYMIRRYLLHALFCALSVLGAYGIVWLYNFYCGHKRGISAPFAFSDLFFPLGIIDSFLGSGEHADVIFGNHAWVYVLILFILSIFYALKNTTLFSPPAEKAGTDIPVIASTAFLGVMHFALYFSHAAYGKLSMCLLPAVILIACLCDRAGLCKDTCLFQVSGTLHEICKRSFVILGTLTLTVLSAEVLTMGPITLGLQGYRDHGKSDIHHLASLYNSVVPPDTFSIGSCVDVLNYQLRQESGAHYRDLSNLDLGGIKVSRKIIDDALEHDYFAVWMMENGEEDLVSGILASDPTYQLVRNIDLGGYPLRVYSRIDELP